MQDSHTQRSHEPAADRFCHFFDRDGTETEPGATKPGGRIVRGAAWHTTSPKDLVREAQVREAEMIRVLGADRRAVVIRRPDGSTRPVRSKRP